MADPDHFDDLCEVFRRMARGAPWARVGLFEACETPAQRYLQMTVLSPLPISGRPAGVPDDDFDLYTCPADDVRHVALKLQLPLPDVRVWLAWASYGQYDVAYAMLCDYRRRRSPPEPEPTPAERRLKLRHR